MITLYVRSSGRRDFPIALTFPFNRAIIDAIKTVIPHTEREFDPVTKVWFVGKNPARVFEEIARIAKCNLEFEGGRTTSSTPQTPNDHAILQVAVNAPDYVITAAYKALAKRMHPDAGGNTQEMQRINDAYARLMAKYKQEA